MSVEITTKRLTGNEASKKKMKCLSHKYFRNITAQIKMGNKVIYFVLVYDSM